MIDIELEIDGKKIKVPQGTMIIEAADREGIFIPRFCYHEKLSIAANCRMCLVEVSNSKKPLPACATPVTAGIQVYTQSKLALDAQRDVMQFLLANHPLDCPICDQGGECELQDLSMGYGRDCSTFSGKKRAVANEDLGPLIDTEMTRCIHCTRCVRFGEEVAGMRELGATGRGENMRIGTYIKHAVQSEVAGNVIDLCPVGALTAKPSRYQMRGWELQQHPAIAPHDCLGSHIFHHTRHEDNQLTRRVMRSVPRPNEAINAIWASDRDRFSYQGLYHAERLTKPMLKKDGQWVETDWQTILPEIAAHLQTVGSDLAAVISPSSTLEECYLLQKLIRTLGSHHIDHRIHEQDYSDADGWPASPGLGLSLAAVSASKAILLVGSYVRHEQPLLNLRIRQASLDGCAVMTIHAIDYEFNYDLREKIIETPQNWLHTLMGLVAALEQQLHCKLPETIASQVRKITITPTLQKMAAILCAAGKNSWIALGQEALAHPQASALRFWVAYIAGLLSASWGLLTTGANAAGAWLAGAVPHRQAGGIALNQPGLGVRDMWKKSLGTYWLHNVELELDDLETERALQALKAARCVVVTTTYATEVMREYAHYLLPLAPYTESGGTYVNACGEWQSFEPVSVPRLDSKPGWKILRTVAQLAGKKAFYYESRAAIQKELRQLCEDAESQELTWNLFMPEQLEKIDKAEKLQKHEKLEKHDTQESVTTGFADRVLYRLAHWPMYRIDPLVRRADALQKTPLQEHPQVRICSKTAASLNLTDGVSVKLIQRQRVVTLPVCIDERVAAECVLLPMGLLETQGFGKGAGSIQLQRED